MSWEVFKIGVANREVRVQLMFNGIIDDNNYKSLPGSAYAILKQGFECAYKLAMFLLHYVL